MKYSRITGTGSYLPKNIMTNVDWTKHVDTSEDWIFDRTGIESRHFASAHETTSSMGSIAAKQALEMAGISAREIDLIIVSTGLPDKIFPSTACLIQQQIGAPIGVAFDVQAACSGFIYALSLADALIKQGTIKNALVISSEIMSRLINWKDRGTCVLFGDGAGAVVLSRSETPGILTTKMYADGTNSEMLRADNPALELNSDLVPNEGEERSPLEPYIHMEGRRVFKVAVSRLGDMVTEVQQSFDLGENGIDWLIPHQANFRIISAIADKLQMSMDKVVLTVAKHANTSSASIPLALDQAVRDGRVQKGQHILFEAFGAGLTWGSALVKF